MKFLDSLQTRLIFIIVVLSMYVWGAAAMLTLYDTRHELDELLDSHLSQTASLLLAGASQAAATHEIDAPSLHRYAPKVAFQVFKENSLTVHSVNASHAPMSKIGSGFSTIELQPGVFWRVFGIYRVDGNIQVFVGEESGARQDILYTILRSVLWPIALALPILLGGSWWAIRSGFSPIRNLKEAISKKQASPGLSIEFLDTPAEIKPLVDELNALLKRLNKKIEHERQFTADVAHELRTPIAALKIHLEVLTAELGPSHPNLHTIQTLHKSVFRTVRLVDQLLEMARLDDEEGYEISWTTDVLLAAESVAADIANQTFQKQQTLIFNRPKDETGLAIHLRSELLASLIRNLLDNAVKYAGSGATIVIEVRRDDNHVVLTVEDSGPSLTASEQEKLGTRFFRGNRDSAVGSGLGWSIIKKIVQLSQGTLSVSRSQSLGGLRVDVSWRPAI